MAKYNIGRNARYHKLTSHGLMGFEARVISGAYPTLKRTDFTGHDSSVYLRRMMKARIQTVINLRRYGYEDKQIEEYILKKYSSMGWTFHNGKPNPFKMLDYYRQKSMEYGEYFPKARRHGRGKGLSISKGDVKAQRERARARARDKKGKSNLDDYEKGRMR